ncbi:TPM domain-containing protein [Tannockella kyphosi]|uniref:TPM domain-containing protein n=1 Tax=Tannockella kyphosi TaxID=2899121 RepID=UPI0020132041|nr:TPM domain-containing protein [Tannockella kyphosi]
MKKVISALTCCLFVCCCSILPTYASDIYDESNLISSECETAMQEIIDEVRETYDFDICVVTVDDYGSEVTMRSYTDDLYTQLYNDSDGVILVLSLDTRDWYISTEGYGDFAINDYCLDQMEEKVISDFSSGDYDEGFYDFVYYSSLFVKEAKTDTPYTYSHEYKEFTDIFEYLIYIVVGSVVVSILYVVSLSKQMNTIRANDSAGNYLSRETFNLTDSNDRFLYSHVSKTVKPKNNGGGGGRGGGGGSSGGRGGKF